MHTIEKNPRRRHWCQCVYTPSNLRSFIRHARTLCLFQFVFFFLCRCCLIIITVRGSDNVRRRQDTTSTFCLSSSLRRCLIPIHTFNWLNRSRCDLKSIEQHNHIQPVQFRLSIDQIVINDRRLVKTIAWLKVARFIKYCACMYAQYRRDSTGVRKCLMDTRREYVNVKSHVNMSTLCCRFTIIRYVRNNYKKIRAVCDDVYFVECVRRHRPARHKDHAHLYVVRMWRIHSIEHRTLFCIWY